MLDDNMLCFPSEKGVNPIISAVLVLVISISGIAIVLDIGMPALDRSRESSLFDEAVSNLEFIDNTVQEVKFGGNGTSRTVTVDVTDGSYYFNGTEDTVTFEHDLETDFLSGELCKRDGNSLTRTFGSGRVLDLRFNEGEGNLTMDCSRHGNDGQIDGAEWNDSLYGTVLDFEGDDEVVIEDDDSLDQTTYTISAWVIWESEPGNIEEDGSFILGAIENYGLAVSEEDGEIYPEGGFVDTEGDVVEVTSNQTIESYEWNHLAFSYDEDREELRIYVNGNLTGSIEHDVLPQVDDHEKVVGYVPEDLEGGFNEYGGWEGKINDVRVYDRAFHAEEIEALSRRSSLGSPDKLNIQLLYDSLDIQNSFRVDSGRHQLLFRNTGHEERTGIEVLKI